MRVLPPQAGHVSLEGVLAYIAPSADCLSLTYALAAPIIPASFAASQAGHVSLAGVLAYIAPFYDCVTLTAFWHVHLTHVLPVLLVMFASSAATGRPREP